MEIIKMIVALLILFALGTVIWFLLGLFVKKKWPARIPQELSFQHKFKSNLQARQIAERLVEIFNSHIYSEVVCLGPVRGNAARVLFHVGQENKGRNRNIYRPDYLVQVTRNGKDTVVITLELNRPYSHFRINRTEVDIINKALIASFGNIKTL